MFWKGLPRLCKLHIPKPQIMKKLFTLSLACACLSVHSQSGLMPYNPDSNGDALIGSQDLISLLGVYNTLMIDSSLTCDYEGTELESWMGGMFDGTLILDSIYVEYLFIDSSQIFLPGCPDPVMIETVLDRSYWLSFTWWSGSGWSFQTDYLGYPRGLYLYFNNDNGRYDMDVFDSEMGELTSYSGYSDWNASAPNCCNFQTTLPFPETWTLDEDGIQVDWTDWAGNCEHFRLIPYWHEAE